MVGCNNLNNKEENHIMISKNDIDDTLETGVNYKISSLMKGKYNIEICAKEYKLGELKKEYSLFKDKIKINDSESLSICVYKDEESLFSGINGDYISNNLELFNKLKDRDMAMSILDDEKELELNKEIPICAYSIGKENEGVTSISLSEDSELKINESNLLIYLKVSKVFI